jgi:SWI/SNF-related matrix-associated actin-dependent regulator of chromatin subfamily A3
VTSKKDKRSGHSLELIKKILSESSHDTASRIELLCNNLDLSDEECPICLEAIDNPVVTPCAHFFCKPCITQHLNNEASNSSCPACRYVISVENLVAVPKNGYSKDSNDKEKKCWRSSTKIDTLMNDLQSIEDIGIKTIIFSQWTSMLDLVEIPLREKGLKVITL